MAYANIIAGTDDRLAHPAIRRITIADVIQALRSGLDDFMAMPSHAVFLCVIYPIVGLVLSRLAFGYAVLPLLYPLMAGFALLGPFAALGLYELSRRREAGLDVHWTHAFDVLRSPSRGAIAILGVLLMAIFLAWLASAQAIYQSLFGVLAPRSAGVFVDHVVNTAAGHRLILFGNAVGFLFALWVLAISVVSFPMLVDRNVGAAAAIATSVRAALSNPLPIAVWGLIIAGLLALGSIPFLFGLAVVIPVLGHATWHLYRKLVT